MTRKPQFVVDVNVGRVATWLRVMGYDTLFPQERGDNELVRLALRDGRVLVTRDSGIAARRAARLGQLKVVQVVDDDLPSQLRQLVRELGLKLDGGFSRCVRCNDPLIAVAKADVDHQVPPLRASDPDQLHAVSPVPPHLLARDSLVQHGVRTG